MPDKTHKIKRGAILLTALFFFSVSWAPDPSPPDPKPRTRLGNEIFCQSYIEDIGSKRLGLVVNSTSLLPEGKFLIQALLDQGINIGAIFSPEHGLFGDTAAGINVSDSRYESIPVFSLYGKTRKPLPEQIALIDAFVYDIQDVGTRFYTYISTLRNILECAAPAGIPVYVLDRPNPLGGEVIEGPIMRDDYRSFIGAVPIPVRYGLTIGELALMMRGEGWVPATADIRVIPIQNWTRDMFWNETGLDWIPPSPNIPSFEASLLFPGIALMGEVGINGGIGTENPFLQFGTPWLNSAELLEKWDPNGQGIDLEEIEYTPGPIPGKAPRFRSSGQVYRGILITVNHPDAFRSVGFSLKMITALLEIHPDELTLKRMNMNRLFGSDHLSQYVKGEISLKVLLEIMERDKNAFRDSRRPYLLYE